MECIKKRGRQCLILGATQNIEMWSCGEVPLAGPEPSPLLCGCMATSQLMPWPRHMPTKVIGFMVAGKNKVVRMAFKWTEVHAAYVLSREFMTGLTEFRLTRQRSMRA